MELGTADAVRRPASAGNAGGTISPEERARRLDAVNFARANVGLEGFVPDAAYEAIALRYVNGELDREGFRKATYASVQQLLAGTR